MKDGIEITRNGWTDLPAPIREAIEAWFADYGLSPGTISGDSPMILTPENRMSLVRLHQPVPGAFYAERCSFHVPQGLANAIRKFVRSVER